VFPCRLSTEKIVRSNNTAAARTANAIELRSYTPEPNSRPQNKNGRACIYSSSMPAILILRMFFRNTFHFVTRVRVVPERSTACKKVSNNNFRETSDYGEGGGIRLSVLLSYTINKYTCMTSTTR